MTDQAFLNSKQNPFTSFRASSPMRNSVQNKENYPTGNINIDSHYPPNKMSVPSTMQKRRLSESISVPPTYLTDINPTNSILKMSEKEHEERLSEDPKLLYQEILSLKKALGDSQARAVLATKELSKIQYENATLQLQTKKAEAKCKDMIDQHSSSQVKLNEVNFLNSKLNAELTKLRMNAQENSTGAKEEFQRLKKSLGEIEDMMQMKNKKIFAYANSAKKILEALHELFEDSQKGLAQKCSSMFQQSKDYVEKIVKIIDNNNLVPKLNVEEANVVKTLNQVIYTYETENAQLADELAKLKTYADREVEQEKIVSQYKASIEKLKEAVNAVKEKLKELQNNKEAEKEYYENKVQKIQQNRDKLLEENTLLKESLSSYETRLKEAGDLIHLLRENIDNPHQIQKPQQSFKPTEQISERASLQSHRRASGEAPTDLENNFIEDQRAPIRNSLGNRAKVSRGWSGDEKRHDVKDSRFTTPVAVGRMTYSHQRQPSDLNIAQPRNSEAAAYMRNENNYDEITRRIQQNDDLLERMKSFRRKVEKNQDGEMRRSTNAKVAAKGLKKEINSLDSEIIQLEKHIRQELSTNQDLTY